MAEMYYEPDDSRDDSDPDLSGNDDANPLADIWLPRERFYPNGEQSNEDPVAYEMRRHIEGALIDIGICDASYVDYLSDLSVRFQHTDRIWSVRAANGRPIMSIVDMLDFAQAHQEPEERYRVYKQVGDITLFYMGFYPQVAQSLQRSDHGGVLSYESAGKRSYEKAADLLLIVADDYGPDLFLAVSKDFEAIVYGMHRAMESFQDPI